MRDNLLLDADATYIEYQEPEVSVSSTTFTGGAPGTPIITVAGAVGPTVTFGGTTGLTFISPSTSIITVAGTLVVANGGSGRASATAYAVICGGTTSTGAHQSVVSVGSSGQVLTSNGAGVLPSFQSPATSGTVTSVAMTVPAGFSVSGSPVTTSGTLAVSQISISVRAYNNADISINNTTFTALTLNSERWDSDSMHSTSSNTSRLTATTAGLYEIGGCASFASGAGNIRLAGIRVNGATYIAFQAAAPPGGGNGATLPVNASYSLAATDYVELVVYQDSGGALNVVSAANYSPEFWMTRLGPQP